MRIAIVNDLAVACEALRRVLAADPSLSVAWIARDGAEAVECARRDKPDLLLMDLIMPKMDGVAATREIMRVAPCPILVVTATVSGNAALVYEALGAGALDAVNTPTIAAKGARYALRSPAEAVVSCASAAPAPAPAAAPASSSPSSPHTAASSARVHAWSASTSALE